MLTLAFTHANLQPSRQFTSARLFCVSTVLTHSEGGMRPPNTVRKCDSTTVWNSRLAKLQRSRISRIRPRTPRCVYTNGSKPMYGRSISSLTLFYLGQSKTYRMRKVKSMVYQQIIFSDPLGNRSLLDLFVVLKEHLAG